MTNILVLGGTGMLGSMLADYLSTQPDLRVTATTRDAAQLDRWGNVLPGASWRVFDVETFLTQRDAAVLDGQDWILNAIGIIKPYIRDDDSQQVQRAVRVNSLFPHALAEAAAARRVRVLQIATDCVYSGRQGRYTESDPHDALDVYGKSKSLGEVRAPGFHNIRCSIIGPESSSFRSLLEWFLSQQPGAQLTGFTDHRWNGVTTLHYAGICAAIVRADPELPALHHLIPAGAVSKADMLEAFAREFGRDDLLIQRRESGALVDRTLATTQAELNGKLWALAGFREPLTVAEMVAELARYEYRPRRMIDRLAGSTAP